jgi:hypothetical protein
MYSVELIGGVAGLPVDVRLDAMLPTDRFDKFQS